MCSSLEIWKHALSRMCWSFKSGNLYSKLVWGQYSHSFLKNPSLVYLEECQVHSQLNKIFSSVDVAKYHPNKRLSQEELFKIYALKGGLWCPLPLGLDATGNWRNGSTAFAWCNAPSNCVKKWRWVYTLPYFIYISFACLSVCVPWGRGCRASLSPANWTPEPPDLQNGLLDSS